MLYLLAAPSTLEPELSRAPAFLFSCSQSLIASFPAVPAPSPSLVQGSHQPQPEIPHLPGSSDVSFLPHGTICH